ncbi:hypothetical protein [Rickettsiales endosymbiont of Trichoplax sp. H2]|uniref:hypothetical protein n=1 Tax=Rickettsiales endosymbiont of Trichoplax sp. H2 TaxID=2021221 RepID=UPI0012B3B1B2|nr:hypothetical protein [Rickettsiales endosymbiont of Trichoplax sp. H2]MSO14527.1 hypothetical protein [Rickettsiales endosymbiont of Trichoplax sp. H2]
MHKLSVNISDKDHRIFKIYAAAKSQTLSEVVIESVKEKISRDMNSPNDETKKAISDSENNIDLTSYDNIEKLISNLGI